MNKFFTTRNLNIKIKKTFAVAAVTLLVASFTTWIAYAAIPDDSGIIHSCRTNLTGSLRIIDSANQSCTELETELNWEAANTTKVYSKRLNVDYDTAPQKLLSVPGWGELWVTQCGLVDNLFATAAEYRNTTSHDVSIMADDDLVPNSTKSLNTEEAMTRPTNEMFSFTDNGKVYNATLTYTTYAFNEPVCGYQAQVVISADQEL